MSVQPQITEEELKVAFAITLGQGISQSGIFITYLEDNQPRLELGVPYSLANGCLEIGPYLKNMVTSPPKDYVKRKKQIPISNILRYKSIDLSDLLE